MTRSYGYDTAGRLASVSIDGATAASYTYDGNGNRLTRVTGEGSEAGSYDGQDRLSSYDGTTYGYGANGELQSATGSEGTTTYSYDELGSLRTVTRADGMVIDYVIDGMGRRIGKKVNGVLVSGWLYGDALRIVTELDGANAEVSRFVYGTHSNVPDLMMRSGVTYRIVSDHLGSPRLVVDVASGTVAQRIEYDEFGNVVSDTNPGFQPFGFAGGLYDRDTGLVRFGARDYDPQTGRWTTKDPIGFAGLDTNLYVYAYNDPINEIDPMGLYSLDDFVEDAANFSAGYGDNLTFGLTNVIRNQIGGNEGIDRCSGIYSAGEWAGIATSTAIGAAGGLRAAGAKAAGKEFSHWIPGRALKNAPGWVSQGVGLSRANGNYVSAAEHALNDPFRYRFMPRAWKGANPINGALARQLNRIPNALIGTGAGAAYGGTSAATNGGGCGCQ